MEYACCVLSCFSDINVLMETAQTSSYDTIYNVQ